MSESDIQPAQEPEANLPPGLRARFNGELQDAKLVAWALFDLDENNRFVERYAVLTDEDLLIVAGAAPAQVVPIKSIEEATIVEGLGVDRLNIIVGGKRLAELRYSRKNRREMTRLHRKLERRMPRTEGKELPPDWLEA